MGAIKTYTGIMVDPINAKDNEIVIEDIAHALSLLCRANGHFPHFYSVAQHCINCAKESKARGYSDRVQLGCLLHDASEAYLSDITRPVKPYLSGYLEIEDRLQGIVFDKWVPQLTEDERKSIFEIDDTILYYEFVELKNAKLTPEEPILISKPIFDFVEFTTVESEFLGMFEEFISNKYRP